MNMTINGKTLADALEELQREERTSSKGNTGFKYIEIESFFNRMDEVLGCFNYSVEYPEFNIFESPDGQILLRARCRITLYSDDREIIKVCEGYGDHELSKSNTNGKFLIKNCTSNTTCAAFKDACKCLGIFGYRRDNTSDKPSVNPSTYTEKAEEVSDNTTTASTFRIVEPFKMFGNGNYKVKADKEGETCEVVFFQNQYSKEKKKFLEILDYCQDKQLKIVLLVTKGRLFNGVQQYIYKGIANAA